MGSTNKNLQQIHTHTHTHTKPKKQPKHTKDSQTIREENKRRLGAKRPAKTNPKQ